MTKRLRALGRATVYYDENGDLVVDQDSLRRLDFSGDEHEDGSGRMEKVVDQAVALRQKRKGMSWTETGSRSLTHLRTVELNGMWDDFWMARAA